MKIRNGFVSNSSSSSFTMIVSEDDHKRIMEAMDADAREYVRFFIAHGQIGEQKVIAIQHNSGERFCDTENYFGGFYVNMDSPDEPTKEERKQKYFFDYASGARDQYMSISKQLSIKRVEVDLDF